MRHDSHRVFPNAITVMVHLGIVLTFIQSCTKPYTEKDFWKWFQNNENDLFHVESDRERRFDRLGEEMHKLNPSLTFEFGPEENGRREFVISADGIKEAFPAVEALYSAAPALPRWKFTKFRPRRKPMDVSYGGVTVKAELVKVQIQHQDQVVDLKVFIPGYTASDYRNYSAITFLLLDGALGEYDVEMHVGKIDIEAEPKDRKVTYSLEALPQAFDALLGKPGS